MRGKHSCFLSLGLPFAFQLSLKHLSALRTPLARKRERERESRGPWYVAQALAQESLELLSLARLICLFALTSRSRRGYGDLL